MPVCIECGEKEFECIDGLFYCSLCQTQSQDIRVEEEEDFPNVPSVALKAKVDKTPQAEKEVDHGRLWMTHEGFQYILLEQVNALIKLGARQDIKEAVWRLWVMYLSKVGVAFTKTEEPFKLPTTFNCYPRHRDLNPGTTDDPRVKPIRRRKTTKFTQGLSTKKSEAKQEKASLSVTLEAEEFYEGDNPAEEEEDPEEEDELLLEDKDMTRELRNSFQPTPGQIYSRNQSAVIRYHYKSVARTNLITTLALCYLGLLYTGSLTGVGDLIRWVKIGKLPFYSASSSLPEDMKFYPYDTKAFSTKQTPTTRKLLTVAWELVSFLNISDSLPSPDMNRMIHKNLLTLQLPGDLHGLTTNLMARKPIIHYSVTKVLTNHDVTAMAYIIVTLKLLLGLDDSTERKLSTYARKLMEMVSLRQPLFVWEDWFQYMEKKKAENTEFFVPEYRNNVRELQAVSTFTSNLADFSGTKRRKVILPGDKPMKLQRETRESLEQCFSLLCDKWGERNPHKTVVSSESLGYNPAAAATLMEEDPIGFLLASPPKAQKPVSSPNQKERKASINFRKTSLTYITHQENFLEELDKQGLSDFTLYSSCLSSSGGEDSDDEKDQSFCPATLQTDFLATSGRRRRKRKRMPARDAVRQVVSKRKSSQSPGTLNKQELMMNFEKAYEQCTLYYPQFDSIHHRSYDWLVKECSRLIDCVPEELHMLVQKIQIVHFGEYRLQSSNTSLPIFIRSYFTKSRIKSEEAVKKPEVKE